jgi:hypothetical protein
VRDTRNTRLPAADGPFIYPISHRPTGRVLVAAPEIPALTMLERRDCGGAWRWSGQDGSVDVVEAVVAMVQASTPVVVEKPVMLRSTNNIVIWLSPSSLVAKISPDPTKDLGYELSWANLLVGVEAPVVRPAPVLEAVVHRIADRDVTFWEHVPDDAEPPLSSVALASALHDLHTAFGELAPATRTVADRLEATIDALGRESFAAGLSAAEPHLLARAMRTAADAVSGQASTVHGSPHPFNVCRSMAPPASSTLRPLRAAIDRERAPDMMTHARHHLEVVRHASV